MVRFVLAVLLVVLSLATTVLVIVVDITVPLPVVNVMRRKAVNVVLMVVKLVLVERSDVCCVRACAYVWQYVRYGSM